MVLAVVLWFLCSRGLINCGAIISNAVYIGRGPEERRNHTPLNNSVLPPSTSRCQEV